MQIEHGQHAGGTLMKPLRNHILTVNSKKLRHPQCGNREAICTSIISEAAIAFKFYQKSQYQGYLIFSLLAIDTKLPNITGITISSLVVRNEE